MESAQPDDPSVSVAGTSTRAAQMRQGKRNRKKVGETRIDPPEWFK